jgi:hypothetical protein
VISRTVSFKSVIDAGFESEQSDYPEGVVLRTRWPKEQEEAVFQAIVQALRRHGVSRWEADGVLLSLRGDEEEGIFKTGPDRILRDLRWALRAARVIPSEALRREIAEILLAAGVETRVPLLHDLDVYVRLITDMVTTKPPASVSGRAAADAWRVGVEEAWRLSVSNAQESWRISAGNIAKAAEQCASHECILATA